MMNKIKGMSTLLVTLATLTGVPAEAQESISANALLLTTRYSIPDHGRGRVACEYSPKQDRVLCITDRLDSNWQTVGARLLTVDPSSFSVSDELVARYLHSSFLWADFNNDGNLDFVGFSDMEEPQDNNLVFYFGENELGKFSAKKPVSIDHPVRGGAILDYNNDGCQDLLVLGTAREDSNAQGTYYPDDMLKGDCAGGFTNANRETGLDRVGSKYGRASALADINGDGCTDILIGNYRGQSNDILMNNCRGQFKLDTRSPAVGVLVNGGYYGHTVAMLPYDLNSDGTLDIVVANSWHNDSRGSVTDPAHVLWNQGRGELRRGGSYYYLEAPFGEVVSDFGNTGLADILYATGKRWENYTGAAALYRNGQQIWKDSAGWVQFRETPSVVDFDLDGRIDIVGDGRVLHNEAPSALKGWMGFKLVSQRGTASGTQALVTFEDGHKKAFALGADERGQPANLLTVGFGSGARPVRLRLTSLNGETQEMDLRDKPTESYTTVQLSY